MKRPRNVSRMKRAGCASLSTTPGFVVGRVPGYPPGRRPAGGVLLCFDVADCEDYRALSDSRLLVGVFQKTIARVRRLRTVGDLFRLSRPLSFADGGGGALEAPAGFEKLTVAIKEQRTVVMVYEGSIGGPAQRRVTPRGLLQSRGRAYMTAYCHVSGIEKTYRLDRIREFYVEEP
jgi:hypothetical protein